MIDPSDALRNAMTVSAVLEHTAEPDTPEEVAEVLELKVKACRIVCDTVVGVSKYRDLPASVSWPNLPSLRLRTLDH